MTIYIGVMSGTSADGVDACLIRFARGRPRLNGHVHRAYPHDLREAVLGAMRQVDLAQAADLDTRLADEYAGAVTELLEVTGVRAEHVRAVGCHGQTVLHRPDGPYPTSLQLGDPHRLAVRLGIDVVADFRRADLAAGGQGAPLAPAFHAAVFAAARQSRAVVNIGGIANLTLLPAGEAPAAAFDTGPGNALMDGWIERHRGTSFDADGAWAATGQVQPELLGRLLADPYFDRAPPKSTGREYFHREWLDLKLEGISAAPADVQATLGELTARSIATALERHGSDTQRLFVCGGGAYNGHLLGRLAAALPGCRVETTAALGIAPEHVEAMAFAWLAQRRVRGQVNNRPEMTGAAHPLCMGALIRAPR